MGNVCPNARPISYNIDGAFAERMAVPPEALVLGNVIKVPDQVSDDVVFKIVDNDVNYQDVEFSDPAEGTLSPSFKIIGTFVWVSPEVPVYHVDSTTPTYAIKFKAAGSNINNVNLYYPPSVCPVT